MKLIRCIWLICLIHKIHLATLVAASLTITSQPLPQTDCYGNLVEYSVGVSETVGEVTYQWQRRPPGGVFSDISGANSPSLSVYNIGMYGQNIDGTEYRVLVTDDFGTIISDPAMLHVNSITGITPVVVNSIICGGGSITYSVLTQGAVLSYRWDWNNGSGWTVLSDGSVFSGTTTSHLSISNATPDQSGSYRVSVTFTTLNQPLTDQTCIETSFTRERNLIVRDPLQPLIIYHR